MSIFIDKIGALSIALFMVCIGIFSAKKNLNQIMDHVPEEALFGQVREAAEKVPGVRGSEKLRIQSYGPDAHVDIDIEVDPELSVQEAHQISQVVRIAIQEKWPHVRDVVVHVEPYYPDDHNI